jgi:hypothetical protein
VEDKQRGGEGQGRNQASSGRFETVNEKTVGERVVH